MKFGTMWYDKARKGNHNHIKFRRGKFRWVAVRFGMQRKGNQISYSKAWSDRVSCVAEKDKARNGNHNYIQGQVESGIVRFGTVR